MDEDWNADIEAKPLVGGGFMPVLVLSPPREFGSPIRIELEGAYENEELAKLAALDAFCSMALGRGQP